jgi:hypothetical protein
MPINLSPNGVLGVSLPLCRFPHYYARHLAAFTGTLQLQRNGAALIAGGFPPQLLKQFIVGVCKWGNYPGIGGRVLKRNTTASICSQFANAAAAFATAAPASAALSALISLKGFGVSFASKHLRFLRPDICPILDDQLSRHCGYLKTPSDYQQFANDCLSIAARLNSAGPSFSLPTGAPWGAADVEMSLFACLYLF